MSITNPSSDGVNFVNLTCAHDKKTLIGFENIEIAVTLDEDGVTPLIQIDTPNMPENENGPICKIILNDGPPIHEPEPESVNITAYDAEQIKEIQQRHTEGDYFELSELLEVITDVEII